MTGLRLFDSSIVRFATESSRGLRAMSQAAALGDGWSVDLDQLLSSELLTGYILISRAGLLKACGPFLEFAGHWPPPASLQAFVAPFNTVDAFPTSFDFQDVRYQVRACAAYNFGVDSCTASYKCLTGHSDKAMQLFSCYTNTSVFTAGCARRPG